MPLPPKGDPQRPLRLAIRSTRMLGIIFLAFGICSTAPMMFMGFRAGGPAVGGGMMRVMMLGVMFVYFAPGAGYLVCSMFLERRRTWAAITAMVLAAIQLMLMTIGLGFILVKAPWQQEPIVLMPVGVLVIFIIALAQLEYHLVKSLEAIRLSPVEMQRGFEPLAAIPVLPVERSPHDPTTDPASPTQ